ncbi:hypothetical protein FOZ62_001051 [Perkinsus olseni]|uniref:Uncharacterized protein n=1 Tax=Perkinsus olseni TaxID=32597 RepID=A0A7J6TN93_PEROL|nr:hypothetical protein FOZ62_001051 [Perkinsus olseni]
MPAAPMPLSEYLDRIEAACRPPREWTMACETVMESVGHVLDDHYGTSGPKIKAQIQNLISSGGEVCHKFVTLVKLWGRISGATDSFNNCLSTFALILLAIYHFKSVDIIEKRKRKSENRPIGSAGGM